jgi:DNA-binding NarL/FixJ family response regulator
MSAKTPRELDAFVDAVLAYKPRPKTKAAKRRTRRKKKAAKMRARTHVHNSLTKLESDALALVLEGKSNKQIADLIGTDEQCIKNRVRAAFKKLGIRSTRELLPIAGKTKELLHSAP